MLKLLGSIAVLAALAAGCGADDPAPTAAPTPAPTAAPASTPEGDAPKPKVAKSYAEAIRAYYGDAHVDPGDVEAEYHQPPRPARGGIGDTITLTGSNIGVRIRVTVTGVADPVRASEPPGDGKRYVAVELRLRSTGITILEGNVANAVLTYGGGGTATPAPGVEAACSNGFHESMRIEVGNSAKGCVLFEVPTGRRPRRLQLALELVPAQVGGIWRLR
jgi:hypothetical protein